MMSTKESCIATQMSIKSYLMYLEQNPQGEDAAQLSHLVNCWAVIWQAGSQHQAHFVLTMLKPMLCQTQTFATIGSTEHSLA